MREKNLIRRGVLLVAGLAVLFAAGAVAWEMGRVYGLAFMAFMLTIFVLLTTFPPDEVRNFISTGLVPLTGLAFVGAGAAVGWSDRTGPVRFYEISAQVIPTLVLALTLEVRLVRGRLNHPFGLVFPALILVAVGLGEFAALKAVLTGAPTKFDFQSVVVALVTAFVGVALGALARPPDPDEDDD